MTDWQTKALYARDELGWTQRRIARELGLALVTVQKVLNPAYGERQRADAYRRARKRYASDPAFRARQRRLAKERRSRGKT